MRQTWAVFVDAYRELNAKKLFWITMAISALVVVAFACVSLTPKGVKVLVWEIDAPFLNSNLLPNSVFYKQMFQSLGIEFWLTWAATIIGLIATCSMIPDFVQGGSVELSLSKPISRTRLLLTKYAAGLLFTLLQVLVFSTASFLVIGLRGDEWNPRVFLAVPIVTLAYSYLFSVCALVGLVTRSAIFALIAVMIFWLGVFATDTVERAVMLPLRVQNEIKVERLKAELARVETPADAPDGAAGGARADAATEKASGGKGLLGRAAELLKPRPNPPSPARIKGELVVAEKALARWTRWHKAAFAVKTVLPKTAETTNLLKRVILPESEIGRFRDAQLERAEENRRRFEEARAAARNGEGGGDGVVEVEFGDPRIVREIERRIDARSVWWVLGTSLLFEGLVLGLACWLFSRRDF